MEHLFVRYPRCTTCQKTERWLKEYGILIEIRNIKEQNPSQEELTQWYCASGLSLRRFFSTSGITYREQELFKKLSGMSEEKQPVLLSTDGILAKRSVLADGKIMLAGLYEKEQEEALLK